MNVDRATTVAALIVVALAQSAILGWMVWDRIDLLRSGRPIVLDVVPRDPRDLFRGDYVVLTFPVARLRTDRIEGDKDFSPDDRIFVGLRQADGGSWEAISMHHVRPPMTGQVVFLRGRVTDVRDEGECNVPGCRVISVHYGMEKYFVPEGEGRELEKQRDERRLQVAARVAEDGEAAIAGLIVDGDLRYEEPLF